MVECRYGVWKSVPRSRGEKREIKVVENSVNISVDTTPHDISLTDIAVNDPRGDQGHDLE